MGNPKDHSAKRERLLRVLLIEHDPDDAELCISALRAADASTQIDLVSNPEDFLRHLNQNAYDVVLSDYRIPGWSGMDVLQLLRKQGKTTPFLLVTGTLGDEMAVSCIREGVSDYVLKDRLALLPHAIDRAIGEQLMREEGYHSQQALQQSEARYRELVENAVSGVYRETASGQFLQVNTSLVRMLGYSSKEELMALPALSAYRNPTDRERLLLEEYRRSGRFRGVEVEWKRKDGAPLIVLLNGRGVSDEAGDLKILEIIVEDVTERRVLEKQLHQAQKFEAIGQLAGGIAHDFNNVIGAIMGWAELGGEQAPADSRLTEYFKKIRAQTMRAAGLTRQLLAFARRQILEPQNLQINTIVTDVLSLLEKVIGKDVEIQTSLAPDLGDVRADPSQIEQILMNLCLNARDAMPGGGRLTIKTRGIELDDEACQSTPGLSPGPYVELVVSDDGTGMDAATREHIFEPFFTTKEPGKGTGLGLATVFGIVKQHDGHVSVQSELGRGTTFRICLPAALTAVNTPDSGGIQDEQVLHGGTETLLIADDHEGMREMVCTALESCGYRVLRCMDGEEAIKLFQKHSMEIGLVILDIVMPRLGGREVAARMRTLRPELPVIFTTGYSADNEGLTQVVELGGIVLQKPYDPKKIARRVRQLLDRAPIGAGSSTPRRN
jgi:two-component system cell cycle sensor histidine kinase/response regulator CckA